MCHQLAGRRGPWLPFECLWQRTVQRRNLRNIVGLVEEKEDGKSDGGNMEGADAGKEG